MKDNRYNQKNPKLIRLMLLVIFFTVNSCVDLEEDTSSIISIGNLTSEAEITSSLAPIYRAIYGAYTAVQQRTATYGADDLTTWWAGNKAPFRIYDRFDYGSGENADNIWLSGNAWDPYWNTIYYANSLIDGLKTSTAPEDIVSIAEGEARFLRGMSYFHLVRTYGGVPLILDGVIPTGEETRATVLETYKVIEEDFIKAVALLPDPASVSEPGRASSAAANTALAKLYLTWGGWPVKDDSKFALAATAAKKVIDLNYFELIPIEDLWKLESQNSLESIFSIQCSKEELIYNWLVQGFEFHQARGWSDAYPELQFFRDFPEGPRKDATFRTEIPVRTVVDGKIVDLGTVPWEESERFHPMYLKFTLSEDLVTGDGQKAYRATGFRAIEVFRYAEVLLIYAEAQTHVGQNALALEALNQVKRRAAGLDYKTPNSSVDVTSATADDIVDEAGWELAGEMKRWYDLVRTERVEEIAAKRDPDEQVPLLRQPTKAQYISPLPTQAFLNGSKLTQNPEGFVVQ